jgi:hypothetical protein
MARGHSKTVIKMLASIVARDDVAPAVRIAAGRELLDRGWGKALQKVELEGDRQPQVLEIITTIVDPKDPDNPVIERKTVEGYLPLPAPVAVEREPLEDEPQS